MTLQCPITRESLLTHQAVTGVLEGEFHVGFGNPAHPGPDLYTRLLMEEPVVACLPVGHHLATKSRLAGRPGERAYECLCRKEGFPADMQRIVTHFESLGVPLKFVADAYSIKEALCW